MGENLGIIGKLVVLAFICSLALAAVSNGLRPKQEENVLLFKQKNVLKSFSLLEKGESRESVQTKYESIRPYVINSKGDVLEISIDDVDTDKEFDLFEKVKRRLKGEKAEFTADAFAEMKLPVFEYTDADGNKSYSVPIYGKGLWSTLKGYFALDSDLNTVKGITFYEQKETPGLGAEIEAEWFQVQFPGKKILNEKGELESVHVIKGGAKKGDIHGVDGISGATITADGVDAMIREYLTLYEAHFNELRAR